jgi:hypothetical protein
MSIEGSKRFYYRRCTGGSGASLPPEGDSRVARTFKDIAYQKINL